MDVFKATPMKGLDISTYNPLLSVLWECGHPQAPPRERPQQGGVRSIASPGCMLVLLAL